MKDQFYLTLPSNSSSTYYPNNTVTSFTTQLPQTVTVDGNWEVALVEFHYPCSFPTIDDNSAIYVYAYESSRNLREEPKIVLLETDSISSSEAESTRSAAETKIDKTQNLGDVKTGPADEPMHEDTEDENPALEQSSDFKRYGKEVAADAYTRPPAVEEFGIPKMIVGRLLTGNYGSEREVVSMMNKIESTRKYIKFRFNEETKKIKIYPEDRVFQLELSHKLALQLGFDPREDDLVKNRESIRLVNLHLGLPTHMYVYCDVVEPQFIGDTKAPLVQIVNIDTSDYVYGDNRYIQYHRPHYVPLLKTRFENI